jgi:hypothetical protein
MRYTNTAANISIPDLLVLDVHSLAQIGTYTYTIRVGSETKTITVIVKEPTKKVEFSVLAKVDGSTVSQFVYNKDDKKYYATLGFGVVDPVAGTGDKVDVVAHFNIVLSNFTVPSSGATSGTLPFTLNRSLNGLTDSINDRTPVQAGTGNDGKHVSLTNAANSLLLSLGRTLGSKTYGLLPNESSVTSDTNSTADTNLDDWRSITLTEAGTYTYTLTVDGVTESVTLVVLENPTLTIDSAVIGTTAVPSVSGKYAIEEGKTAVKVTFGVTGKSLPTGDLFYKVWDANIFATAVGDAEANETGDFYVGTRVLSTKVITNTAIEAGAKTLTGLTAAADALPKLGATVDITYPADTSTFGANVRLDRKVIGIYKAGTAAGSYTLVGFKEVEIWILDVVSNA